MKRIVLGIFACFFAGISLTAQTKTAGRNIKFTISPYQKTWVYLGNYYGANQQIADSIFLNENGIGVSKANKKLPKGLYFIASPDKRLILSEFLMDDVQQFTVTIDTSNLAGVKITGSKENTIYASYTQFLNTIGPQLNKLNLQYQQSTNANEKEKIAQQIQDKNNQLNQFRNQIIKQHPNSMLAHFFHTLQKPQLPKNYTPITAADTLAAYYYIKQNFWNNVKWEDESLVRTPFFEPKLEEYYNEYVVPDADSVIAEVKYMLLAARPAPEMYKYLLIKFTNKYLNPTYMGLDKVFLYLFENHYAKGDTAFLSVENKKTIFERAYSLMANQIGLVAPPLNMLDTAAKPVQLHSINSPYTLVVFWDPTCGHCKEEIPRIDSLYKASWKNLGVAIFAVNMDEAVNEQWKSFINEHHLSDWHHAYQPTAVRKQEAQKGIPNFRQLYDVFQTPTLYLLDEQKRIIAKKLSLEQFHQVLLAKIKLHAQ